MQNTVHRDADDTSEDKADSGNVEVSSTVAADPGRRNRLLLLGFVPYLLLLVTAYSVFAESVDDPFITFRYALNLLHGYGPVFNPGERVEGFTSPLHLLLCTLLIKIASTVPLLFKAKLTSLALGLVFLAQVRSLARIFGLTEGLGILAQTLIALNLSFVVPMVNGLETTLYAVLLTASVQCFAEEFQGRRGGVLSAAWLFAAVLARPDALLSFAALGCVQVWRLSRREIAWPTVVRWGLVFLLPLALLTLARLSYFGTPLPNTFYAKHTAPIVALHSGTNYLLRPLMPAVIQLHQFSPLHGPLQSRLLLPELIWYWGLFLLGLGRLWTQRQTLKASFVLLAEIGALFVLVFGTGGDWMMGWRFVLPFAGCVTLVQCLGIASLGQILGKLRVVGGLRRGLIASTGVTLLFWLMVAWVNPHYSWGSVGCSTGDEALLQPAMFGEVWVGAADYIHDSLPPGSAVAGSEMGYAPFVNMDKQFFDIRGLTNSEVAHLHGVPKSLFGVQDKVWYESGSPVGSRILQHKPALIYVVGPKVPFSLILNGQYRATLISPEMQARAEYCQVDVNFYQPVSPAKTPVLTH